jgi:putative addiction module component (TIGR02574 family)
MRSMSTPLTDLETEAMKLPREERARLADHLLASVYADPEIDEAWATEVERRVAAVEAGAPLVAAESALARARQALA